MDKTLNGQWLKKRDDDEKEGARRLKYKARKLIKRQRQETANRKTHLQLVSVCMCICWITNHNYRFGNTSLHSQYFKFKSTCIITALWVSFRSPPPPKNGVPLTVLFRLYINPGLRLLDELYELKLIYIHS